MSINDVSPRNAPLAFAEFVKDTPVDQLLQLMQSERRAAVLDEIFADMPRVFRSEKAGPIAAVIHWNVGDRPDGGVDTYELVIADGTCCVSGQPRQEPRLTLTLGAVDFLKMTTGCASPIVLFMRGRMKAKGDLGLATKFAGLFDIPKA